MENIYVGSTTTLTTQFQDDSSATPSFFDPTVITYKVKNSSLAIIASGTPTRLSLGVYSFNWVAISPGDYTAEFDVTYEDTSTGVIPVHLHAIVPGSSEDIENPPALLDEDVTFVFLVGVSPLIVDPEEFLALFPDAPLSDVAELIYNYSSEAFEITGKTDITPTVREFVFAAVACALSRIYDIAAGGDEIQIGLADLSVTRRSSSGERAMTRATANTWCELAGVIRAELLRYGKMSGMRAIMRGEKSGDPHMPVRKVRAQEFRHWSQDEATTRGNQFN